MADFQQAIAALEAAREFVKGQHDPAHGPSCAGLAAHDNINKGIAALRRVVDGARHCGNCADGVPGGPGNCSKCSRAVAYSHWTPRSLADEQMDNWRDEPLEVAVERGRIWIKRAHRSFMLAYDDPELAHQQWYAEQIRQVLNPHGVPATKEKDHG